MAIVSIVAMLPISACFAPVTAEEPEIIHATPDEISIGAWGWGRPDSIASGHCRRFGKEAVFLATVRADEYDDTRIVYYSCQWPNYGMKDEPRRPATLAGSLDVPTGAPPFPPAIARL